MAKAGIFAQRAMVEGLSAGKGASALPAGVAKPALAQRFGDVMLYGGVAACLSAVASSLVSGAVRARQAAGLPVKE